MDRLIDAALFTSAVVLALLIALSPVIAVFYVLASLSGPNLR
jgi:hypothetical protein